MTALEYHLAELEIARSASDPRRAQPDLPAQFASILDVGCGAGQTLIAASLPPHVLACGVDVDESALVLGRTLAPQHGASVHFTRAGGEALPYADGSFDVVISRVAMPYMHMPTALAEFARVLAPGGTLWVTLHPASLVLSQLGDAVTSLHVKSMLYFGYALLNGAWFHVTGRQVRFPLNRARCESFQTAGGVRRALHRAGFGQVRVTRTARHFAVAAVRER